MAARGLSGSFGLSLVYVDRFLAHWTRPGCQARGACIPADVRHEAEYTGECVDWLLLGRLDGDHLEDHFAVPDDPGIGAPDLLRRALVLHPVNEDGVVAE